jgi:hypothetical protein
VRNSVFLLLFALGIGSSWIFSRSQSVATVSAQTTPIDMPIELIVVTSKKPNAARKPASEPSSARESSPVCEVLKHYPREETGALSFERGEISPLCRPFIRQKERGELDRCGDIKRDPYASNFTWSSRNEMTRRGRANLYTDPEFQPQLAALFERVEQVRESSAKLCCGDDPQCRALMAAVKIDVCKPQEDPDSPDPCVFGGSYRMSGKGYASVFRAIQRQYSGEETAELKRMASRNLSVDEMRDPEAPAEPVSGTIVLSSYVSKKIGIASIDPVIMHEFGHACSMIKMQQTALSASSTDTLAQAHRAVQWLDRARSRCKAEVELPESYLDFWESLGESRELAKCFYQLTKANQEQAVDRTCSNLCPGHFLEETVGIAFSLLLGKLDGSPGAVFPGTCDHVRDGQHPMVSDVVDCMAQHSSRFRERLRQMNHCEG